MAFFLSALKEVHLNVPSWDKLDEDVKRRFVRAFKVRDSAENRVLKSLVDFNELWWKDINAALMRVKGLKIGVIDADEFFDLRLDKVDWSGEMYAGPVQDQLITEYKFYGGQFGIAFNDDDIAAINEFNNKWTMPTLRGQMAGWENEIKDVLNTGVQNNWNWQQVAREMEERVRAISGTKFKRYHFNRIARTETARWVTEGHLNAMDKLGFTHYRRVEVIDDRTDQDLCEPFDNWVYKYTEAHGVVPAHPNCRGDMIPEGIVKDETMTLDKALNSTMINTSQTTYKLNQHLKDSPSSYTRTRDHIASKTNVQKMKIQTTENWWIERDGVMFIPRPSIWNGKRAPGKRRIKNPDGTITEVPYAKMNFKEGEVLIIHKTDFKNTYGFDPAKSLKVPGKPSTTKPKPVEGEKPVPPIQSVKVEGKVVETPKKVTQDPTVRKPKESHSIGIIDVQYAAREAIIKKYGKDVLNTGTKQADALQQELIESARFLSVTSKIELSLLRLKGRIEQSKVVDLAAEAFSRRKMMLNNEVRKEAIEVIMKKWERPFRESGGSQLKNGPPKKYMAEIRKVAESMPTEMLVRLSKSDMSFHYSTAQKGIAGSYTPLTVIRVGRTTNYGEAITIYNTSVTTPKSMGRTFAHEGIHAMAKAKKWNEAEIKFWENHFKSRVTEHGIVKGGTTFLNPYKEMISDGLYIKDFANMSQLSYSSSYQAASYKGRSGAETYSTAIGEGFINGDLFNPAILEKAYNYAKPFTGHKSVSEFANEYVMKQYNLHKNKVSELTSSTFESMKPSEYQNAISEFNKGAI